MNNSSFWIGLPDGWTRTAFDPEYRRQVGATLADTANALPELADQCADLCALLDDSSLFDDGEDPTTVLFAAQYYASPEPGRAIHCVVAICTLAGYDAKLIDDIDHSDDVHDINRNFADLRSVRRRTNFESGPAALGSRTTATAQYFLEAPGGIDSLVVSFSTISVAFWPELLEQFDAIVSTIEFSDAA